MSIENNLATLAENSGRIAAAMEALVAALSQPAVTVSPAVTVEVEKPASRGSARQRKNVEREPDPAPEPDPIEEAPAEDPLGLDDPEPEAEEEAFTEDQVRRALKNYRDVNGAPATMQVLKDHGATGMGDLKPDQYAAVMKIVR